jgi:hypothetical protein
MRRAWFAVTVVLLIGLSSVPASAGEHIRVSPDPVQQGRRIRVRVVECVGGPDWNAVIDVWIIDPDGQPRIVDKDLGNPASNTGLDIFIFRIRARDYAPGLYKAKVECTHEFDEGPQTFFLEKEAFRVVEP